MGKNDNNRNNFHAVMAQMRMLDLQIAQISEQIEKIKSDFISNEGEEVPEEVCMDELEANRAGLEAMKQYCMAALMETEPTGDA